MNNESATAWVGMRVRKICRSYGYTSMSSMAL